jgi:hypothetical protein
MILARSVAKSRPGRSPVWSRPAPGALCYHAAVAAASRAHLASTPHSVPRGPDGHAFRSAIAVAALLLVGAGVTLPHCHETGEPGQERALRATSLADAALHPAAPAHFESSGARLHPACVACLLQARTPSLQTAPAVVAPSLRDTSVDVLPSAAPASRFAIRLGPARASPRPTSAPPSAL